MYIHVHTMCPAVGFCGMHYKNSGCYFISWKPSCGEFPLHMNVLFRHIWSVYSSILLLYIFMYINMLQYVHVLVLVCGHRISSV